MWPKNDLELLWFLGLGVAIVHEIWKTLKELFT